MPRLFGSFFFKPWDLDSRLEGCMLRDTCHQRLIFKFFEDKSERFKTNLTLILILRFNLRLEDYSMWSVSFIASYIKEDLKTTQA
jgi:hypothetical protein